MNEMDLELLPTDTVEQAAMKLLQAVLIPILNNMVEQGNPEAAASFYHHLLYGLGRARIAHIGSDYAHEIMAVIDELDADHFEGPHMPFNSIEELESILTTGFDNSLTDESAFIELDGKPS